MTTEYEQRSGLALNGAERIQPVERDIADVFTFRVPILSPDGTCSANKGLEETPYDIRTRIDASDEEKLERNLRHIHALLAGAQKKVNADWIGVYQTITRPHESDVLVKLAYQGRESRAEFPLTEQYAALSNNSTVAMTGKGIVIDSVREYHGAYYECDGDVNSEACLPIYSQDFSQVVGIIDAESFSEHHFTSDKVAVLAQLCLQLAETLPLAQQ